MSDEPVSPAPPSPVTPEQTDGVVNRAAVVYSALVGLLILVAASVIDAILDRNVDNYNDSGWRYVLFVMVLVGYFVAGFLAGRRAPGGALTNGALAGTFTFVLWVPVRMIIWAVRDEHEQLFTGVDPVFKPGQIFGHLVIASALGMLGGILGARSAIKRAR
ncbi:MAG TPA: TIGR04086 family membrane protein [Acidimicrobiia bacterium]|nr:TIGR04086 family membrane protein [Acidimicrobiia bacterium]